MTEHVLTMHSTDEMDRLWITCSCGFETEPVEVDADQFRRFQDELATLGRAHVTAETEGGEA
jgi:hypothetical protein